MGAHLRWKLVDPLVGVGDPGREVVFRPNPHEMSPPFAARQVQSMATTAGVPVLYYLPAPPHEFSFVGRTLDKAFYEGLRVWFTEKKHMVQLSDHFGRNYRVYLTRFEPKPLRRVGKYWYHEYTCACLVVGNPSVPTVGEVPA